MPWTRAAAAGKSRKEQERAGRRGRRELSRLPYWEGRRELLQYGVAILCFLYEYLGLGLLRWVVTTGIQKLRPIGRQRILPGVDSSLINESRIFDTLIIRTNQKTSI